MPLPDHKLRVGVTLHVREGQQSIWENGIFQNCAFLVQLLNQSPLVKKAVLVNGGNGTVPHDAMMLQGTGISLMGLTEAMQSLDLIVEMSAQLPDDFAHAFRQKGGRYASMRVGNDYVLDIERAMFDKPNAALISDKHYDVIWTLPQYERTCKSYYELTTGAPVRLMPHLWTPYFFDKGIATLPAGVEYGYKPGKPRWRLCCFEPNVSMVKTSIIPMAACEEAYRARPRFLEYVRFLNTLHLKEHPVFVQYARTLDIVNHGIATFEARFPLYEYMATQGDCIVSHQWENAQNYLYYEALYGGYPLVHNSPMMKESGYYYPDFDCQEGGRAVLRAFDTHDANLDEYKAKAKRLLARLDVNNPANIEAYTREIRTIYESPAR
jgi:hypothetical protein